MKTYQSEWEELVEWEQETLTGIFESNPCRGLDGEGSRLSHELHLEFMRKWSDLKKKYHVD